MLACQESKTRSDLQEKEEAIKARDDTRLTRPAANATSNAESSELTD